MTLFGAILDMVIMGVLAIALLVVFVGLWVMPALRGGAKMRDTDPTAPDQSLEIIDWEERGWA